MRFYALAFTLILAAGFTEHAGWPFGFVMLLAGAHLLWQVKRLDIDERRQLPGALPRQPRDRRADRAGLPVGELVRLRHVRTVSGPLRICQNIFQSPMKL